MLLHWVRVLIVVGVALTAVAFELFGRVKVEGHSMQPTLLPGDRLLMVRWPPARRGDLVVVAHPVSGLLMVKRVVDVHGRSVTVVGDNPAASTDSRTFGALLSVKGRPVYRYYPPHRAGWLTRRSPQEHRPHRQR